MNPELEALVLRGPWKVPGLCGFLGFFPFGGLLGA